MRQLIIKYALLVIVTTLIARLTSFVILSQFPLLLTKINPDGSISTFPVAFIERALEFAMNVFIVILMKKDLDNQNVKSIPILILTFFFSFIGVIFFLLVSLQNKLTLKKLAI